MGSSLQHKWCVSRGTSKVCCNISADLLELRVLLAIGTALEPMLLACRGCDCEKLLCGSTKTFSIDDERS